MRDVLTSPRVKEINRQKRNKNIRFISLLSILIISIIIALSYFSSDRRVVISTITITGNRALDKGEISDLVSKDLSGKYLRLFNRNNTFVYPKSRIYKDLISTFPRIEELSVSRSSFNDLHINIKERSGTYLYCGSQIPAEKSEVGENCYFVNNEGYIFDKAPYVSGDVYFKYYLPLSSEKASPLGEQLLPADKFHSLTRFIDRISALGFKSIYLQVDNLNTYNLYLYHGDSTNIPKVIWKEDSSLDTILDNLTLAIKKPEFATLIKAKYATLEYIDLRFRNKVLYKFQ